MGRDRPSIARSRTPWRRRLLMDPGAIRYWLAVAALAASLAVVVGRSVGRAEHARAAWGRTRPVLVIDRDLAAGTDLRSAVHRVRWPAALVPDAALGALPDGDVTSAAAADQGTLVTTALVRSTGHRSGRTVAISLDAGALPTRPGDLVDLWATTDPSLVPEGLDATRRVASGAEVVSSHDGGVVVVVSARQIGAVANAVATATILLVGSP